MLLIDWNTTSKVYRIYFVLLWVLARQIEPKTKWPAVLMILLDENWISLSYLSRGKRSKVEERKNYLLPPLLKFPVFQIQAGVHPNKISSLNKARAHQKLAKDTDSSGKPFLPPLCYSCHNIPSTWFTKAWLHERPTYQLVHGKLLRQSLPFHKSFLLLFPRFHCLVDQT